MRYIPVYFEPDITLLELSNAAAVIGARVEFDQNRQLSIVRRGATLDEIRTDIEVQEIDPATIDLLDLPSYLRPQAE